jgi:hypothetical protein
LAGDVPAGIVNGVEPVLEAAGSSAGTDRLSESTTSAASSVVFADR